MSYYYNNHVYAMSKVIPASTFIPPYVCSSYYSIDFLKIDRHDQARSFVTKRCTNTKDREHTTICRRGYEAGYDDPAPENP